MAAPATASVGSGAPSGPRSVGDRGPAGGRTLYGAGGRDLELDVLGESFGDAGPVHYGYRVVPGVGDGPGVVLEDVAVPVLQAVAGVAQGGAAVLGRRPFGAVLVQVGVVVLERGADDVARALPQCGLVADP